MNTITILGSGTSTGIPMLGCKCEVCKSPNVKNKRLRSSILLQVGEVKVLVDTTPDLRTQFLDNDIDDIDAVIITHDHADHLHGIDDLRPLCFEHPLSIYTSLKCEQDIKTRFPYMFKEKHPDAGSIPMINLETVELGKQFDIKGIPFEFFLLPHGPFTTLGFMQGSFAYLIDCSDVPEETMKLLKARNLDLLIIDCVQRPAHKTHLNVDKCFKFIKAIAPKQAGLIHMGHGLEHKKLAQEAADNFNFPVFPLYDGLKLNYR
ncbi:MAG: MBL fold metallo-hydrolase [Deltaproteobacteria bacterium]|nr:MAG: MBL fold metallo-hydrolase [Deltaproteobacteria bacterium]